MFKLATTEFKQRVKYNWRRNRRNLAGLWTGLKALGWFICMPVTLCLAFVILLIWAGLRAFNDRNEKI